MNSLAVLLTLALQQFPEPTRPTDRASAPDAKPNDRLPMNVRLPPVILDRDRFVAVDAAAKAGIADGEPILGVTIGRESRAYPIAIVSMDEVVNDELAGVAIAITW